MSSMSGRTGGGVILRSMALLATFMLVFPSSSRADVTITVRRAGQGTSPQSGGDKKIMIKGKKMRIEVQREKEVIVTIYDLDTGKEINLQPKRKTADVYDLSEESAKLKRRLPLKNVKSSIRPTNKSKQLLGTNCDEYTYEFLTPDPPRMIDGHAIAPVERETGTVCISREILGSKDFVDFMQEVKNHSYILGATPNAPIQYQTSTLLLLMIAQLDGVALEISKKTEMLGGPGVGFYGTAASFEDNSTVTGVSTDPISDEEFVIPMGWKIRQDRSVLPLLPVRDNSKKFPPVWAQENHITQN